MTRLIRLNGAFAAVLWTTTVFAADVEPQAVKFEQSGVPVPVTGAVGNPSEGAKIFANRSLGNCLACHANKDLQKELFHGTVGPSIDGLAGRMSKEQIRAIVIDAKKVFGDATIMPGFYTLNVGQNVRKDLVGKTILTAQQVEDVVAYLSTLKN